MASRLINQKGGKRGRKQKGRRVRRWRRKRGYVGTGDRRPHVEEDACMSICLREKLLSSQASDPSPWRKKIKSR